jgi:hypothetical protein
LLFPHLSNAVASMEHMGAVDEIIDGDGGDDDDDNNNNDINDDNNHGNDAANG